MKQSKIVTIGPLPSHVTEKLPARFEIITVGDGSRAEVLEAMDDQVIAIIARGSVMVDAEVMDLAPNLSLISRTGVGYDTVDIPAATDRGIPVLYTPGAMTRAVAEHALSLIFGAHKRLTEWRGALIDSNWDVRYEIKSHDLESKVFGIVGYGRIGRKIRQLSRGFEFKVLANDPYINHADFAGDDVEFTDLPGVLTRSDIVTLHVPLTEETRGMITRERVAMMKPGAILINTARGGVIDGLDILYEALESGPLGAVGLDVFPDEPPDTAHPLFRHPRAYLTGHVAARTPLSQKRILETMLTETLAVLEGRTPNLVNVVNPEVFQDQTLG